MPTKSFSFSSHIISVLVPGWGHLKPFVALASKIVQLRPDVIITIHTFPRCEVLIEREIDRYFRHDEESVKANIRITTVDDEPFRNQAYSPDQLIYGFESFYTNLANCQPIVCPTGKTYPAAPAPTVAIIDMFLSNVAQAIRNIAGNDIPIIGWCPGNLSYYVRVAGPQELGGYGDVSTQLCTLASGTGKPVVEFMDEVYFPELVVNLPGLPLMYGYEYSVQESRFPELTNKIPWVIMAQQFMKLCDGVVSITSAAYEAETVNAWRTWLAQSNRKFYVVGPVPPLPPASEGILKEKTDTVRSTEPNTEGNIVSFLDEALERYGRNSLFYISFGSVWWPKDEHIWKLIEILMECKVPFILAHASRIASFPPALIATIQANGIGLLSPWTPQHLILKHPATGWFLTHCGINSIMEALSEGIPMITWPLRSDQPPGAARLTIILDVAFELLEVRTGKHSHKPLYRGFMRIGTDEAFENEIRRVLTDARGSIGEQKRKNVHRIRDAMKGAWDEGGDALRELRNMLKDFC